MTFRSARIGAHEARPSFAAAAEEHLDAVYRYLLLMTRNDATAQDLTSETFEKALHAWRRFDPRRASARTWLCQIARNTALDHFRGEGRRRVARLVLVVACLALLAVAGVAAVYGLVTSGGRTTRERAAVTASPGRALGSPTAKAAPPSFAPATTVELGLSDSTHSASAGLAKLPPTSGRLQQYGATTLL